MARLGAGIARAILVLAMMVVPSMATVYNVGDTTGWTMGVDYSTWTKDKTFVVGDSLVFNYGGGHTVDEVSASDYNTCTVGNAISTDNSGATTISLKTVGAHYFICGAVGHCGSGMKVAVTVAASGSGTPPSSASGTPSSGTNSTSSPTSGGSTTTTNRPPSNYVPESASGRSSLFLAIMATWVAFGLMIFS